MVCNRILSISIVCQKRPQLKTQFKCPLGHANGLGSWAFYPWDGCSSSDRRRWFVCSSRLAAGDCALLRHAIPSTIGHFLGYLESGRAEKSPCGACGREGSQTKTKTTRGQDTAEDANTNATTMEATTEATKTKSTNRTPREAHVGRRPRSQILP